MTEPSFGLDFSNQLIARVQAGSRLHERQPRAGEPMLSLTNATNGSAAGALRLWAAEDDSQIDRLIHFRLQSPPVDTHLLFLFARPRSPMPHFHAQVVQFASDSCVYNADVIPRLDPVEHPAYFREVYGPITKAYWKATTDRQNVCSMAPANPAIAIYLSPWSIAASRPTGLQELQRVMPSIFEYLDHCLSLSRQLTYAAATPEELAARDQQHMRLLHSDELDPRAWKGVYRVIGQEVGRQVREILQTPIR